MKKNQKIRLLLLMVGLFSMMTNLSCFAESVSNRVPVPYNVTFTSDGEVSWNIDNEGPDYPTNPNDKYIYKKFQVKLQKRYAKYTSVSSDLDYEWKDFGSVKSITVSSNEPSEYMCSVDISSPGYYVALVRAYTVDSIYSQWSAPSNSSAFDSSTTNISITDGSSVASNYGPGTVYNGTTGMQVQNPYQNYGGASNIIGANGQYITKNGQGSAYVYDNAHQNNINYQGQSTANIGVGPGVNNGATADTYTPGPGTNTQVYTGVQNNSVSSPNYNGSAITNTNQIIQTGPSQSGNSVYGGVNWSTEVGWHSDANGFYYYQGNGTYLRNQWYLIDNHYYRFNEQGYALINKWFKDPTNGAWYYMGVDGKMLTGWQ
ncbi:MAG: hypothetical protein MJ151_02160, partial [Lachnospiraceae bacterium]|nr:hypothetical protein [Lachnospiraceae bacterium]